MNNSVTSLLSFMNANGGRSTADELEALFGADVVQEAREEGCVQDVGESWVERGERFDISYVEVTEAGYRMMHVTPAWERTAALVAQAHSPEPLPF